MSRMKPFVFVLSAAVGLAAGSALSAAASPSVPVKAGIASPSLTGASGGAATRTPAGANTARGADKSPSRRESVRQAARKATAAAGAAAAAAAAVMALSDADDEQRQAFSLTHLGDHACEFRRSVLVAPHPTHEGYVDLHFDRRVVTAKPVLSSTGAIRLEDVRGQFVMLQIAFKSMVLDLRSGQRVADECLHARHHEARQAAAQAPAQPGLGIAADPAR